MISLFHKDEFGFGLQYQTDKKIGVKTDNTGNVQFELSEAGLKGTVQFPAAFDPANLETQIQEAKQLAQTADNKADTATQRNGTQDTELEALRGKVKLLEDGKLAAEAKVTELQNALNEEKAKVTTLEGKVTALENREDLHASNLRLDDATNEVVLTVEGGQELRVNLGKFMNVVPSFADMWAGIKALPAFKTELLNIIRGEEVQNLAGETKGYLLSAN